MASEKIICMIYEYMGLHLAMAFFLVGFLYLIPVGLEILFYDYKALLYKIGQNVKILVYCRYVLHVFLQANGLAATHFPAPFSVGFRSHGSCWCRATNSTAIEAIQTLLRILCYLPAGSNEAIRGLCKTLAGLLLASAQQQQS